VRDMDAAYRILQDNNVQQVSAYPITIPASNPGAAGIKAIKFHDPERHDLELIYFPPARAICPGTSRRTSCFSGSTTPP
jgi:hypothetical protein